jgi:hypothetical protein
MGIKSNAVRKIEKNYLVYLFFRCFTTFRPQTELFFNFSSSILLRNGAGMKVYFSFNHLDRVLLVTWVVVQCGFVGGYQRFGGTYCLYLQG